MPSVPRKSDRLARFTATRRALRLLGLPGPPEWRDRMRLFERCAEVEREAGRVALDADLRRLAVDWRILRGRHGRVLKLSPDLFQRVLVAHPWIARLGDWGRGIATDSLFAWMQGRAVGWVMPGEALVGLWTSEPRFQPPITADDLYLSEAERIEKLQKWGREALKALAVAPDDPERTVAVPEHRDPAARDRLLDLLARRVVLDEAWPQLARDLSWQAVAKAARAEAKRLDVDVEADPFTRGPGSTT